MPAVPPTSSILPRGPKALCDLAWLMTIYLDRGLTGRNRARLGLDEGVSCRSW
jgi:hypothetical protein